MRIQKKDEAAQLKAQLVRALADYDNLVKRVAREKEEFEKSANLKLAIKLLPVMDVLRQAQKHLADPGIAITIGQFEDALKSEGIEEIRVERGEKFDPHSHEAVETLGGGKKGTVAELVLSGWKFKDLPAQAGGKIIRHAKVKVFGPPTSKKEELEKEIQRGEYV